uniref:Uncharacterized protein n=1 Tax=Anopheles farauti TaxID=69004 RepID=A0A182Q2Y3_9DIPT
MSCSAGCGDTPQHLPWVGGGSLVVDNGCDRVILNIFQPRMALDVPGTFANETCSNVLPSLPATTSTTTTTTTTTTDGQVVQTKNTPVAARNHPAGQFGSFFSFINLGLNFLFILDSKMGP